MTDIVQSSVIDTGKFPVRFMQGGTTGQPLLVFIHGTPGSWQAYQALLSDSTLREHFHLIALDRLGFGASAASGAQPSFATQAQAISQLFSVNQSACRVILAGHSLGGSIAYRTAIDYPAEVGALLVISSAIDPDLSSPRWYNHFVNLPGVSWIMSRNLNVANKEMMPLAQELQKMQESLTDLTLPITILQGAKDRLVDTENVEHAEKLLSKANLRVVRFPERGHFVFWQEHDAVVKELMTLRHQLEQTGCPIVQQNSVQQDSLVANEHQ